MTTPARPPMGTVHNCQDTAPGDLGANAAGRQLLEGFSWVSLMLMDRGSAPKAKWVSTSLPGQPSQAALILMLLARSVTLRQASVAMVSLAANATTTLTATWDNPWPDDKYTTDVQLPAALVGKVAVSVKAQTAASVQLTVTAGSVAVVAGSTLDLIGARWA